MESQIGAHRMAIATVSMGWHESHTLERKISAAADSGIEGIELCWEDFEKFATIHSLSHLEAASAVKDLCEKRKLAIVTLQPFLQFEGSKLPLEERLTKAREWVQLARTLGTDIIQVASNWEVDSSGDEKTIVAELKALADIGAESRNGETIIRFGYEAISWATHVALWEDSVRIVKLVDKPNFGLCLDTYHVLARIWADPRSLTGRLPGADFALRESMARFLEICPVDKIFFIQLSDGEKVDPPLLPGHPYFEADKDPSILWCVWGRLFPFEADKGAYLPMKVILDTWLRDKGWQGWVSFELFHRDEKEEVNGPEIFAERGIESWKKVLASLAE
jgi:sugar phosphate isomerase/epimerase